MKEFFDYFKETTENEFEAFEVKTLKVDSIEIKSGEELLRFFESAGEVVRPTKIQFNEDGTNEIIGWSIGKTIDELYKEREEQINNEVEGFEARCFNNKTDIKGLKLLAQQLRDTIYLYRHRNNDFKYNPKQQRKIKIHYKNAANRLENLLNDVVLTKIEFRKSKATNKEKPELTNTTNKETEPAKTEFSEIVKKELEQLQQAFNNDNDFQKAIMAIHNFFISNQKPEQPIFVKNGNIKNLAFALGEIWRSKRNDVINLEYLKFYKSAFSIFANQSIDGRNIFGCNLYKYSISKT